MGSDMWSCSWSWVMSLCVYSLNLWQVLTIRGSPQWLQKGNSKTIFENNKKDYLENNRIISLNKSPEKAMDKIHLKAGTWRTRLWLRTQIRELSRAYNVWPICFPFVMRFLALLWKEEKWMLLHVGFIRVFDMILHTKLTANSISYGLSKWTWRWK